MGPSDAGAQARRLTTSTMVLTRHVRKIRLRRRWHAYLGGRTRPGGAPKSPPVTTPAAESCSGATRCGSGKKPPRDCWERSLRCRARWLIPCTSKRRAHTGLPRLEETWRWALTGPVIRCRPRRQHRPGLYLLDPFPFHLLSSSWRQRTAPHSKAARTS